MYLLIQVSQVKNQLRYCRKKEHRDFRMSRKFCNFEVLIAKYNNPMLSNKILHYTRL